MESKKNYNIECNVAHVLNIIGDKWTLLIIHNIIKKPLTFKELKEILINIPTNLLSNRLKYLEKMELITSRIYSEHPPRYIYEITNKALELKPVIYSIMLWGEKNLEICNETIKSKEEKDVEVVVVEKGTNKILKLEDVYITVRK